MSTVQEMTTRRNPRRSWEKCVHVALMFENDQPKADRSEIAVFILI